MQIAKQQPASHPQDSKDLALTLAGLLDRKKGTDIAILDVSGPLVITDYFVVATAHNPRHAQALGRELESTMKQAGLLRRNVAGMEGENSWVLLDFDDVVAHIFIPESRAFYALEDLWADVPRLPFAPDEAPEIGAGTGPVPPITREIRPDELPPGSTPPT